MAGLIQFADDYPDDPVHLCVTRDDWEYPSREWSPLARHALGQVREHAARTATVVVRWTLPDGTTGVVEGPAGRHGSDQTDDDWYRMSLLERENEQVDQPQESATSGGECVPGPAAGVDLDQQTAKHPTGEGPDAVAPVAVAPGAALTDDMADGTRCRGEVVWCGE